MDEDNAITVENLMKWRDELDASPENSPLRQGAAQGQHALELLMFLGFEVEEAVAAYLQFLAQRRESPPWWRADFDA